VLADASPLLGEAVDGRARNVLCVRALILANRASS
jgi:hypothetical protein